MGVAGLVATGNDRACRNAARAQNCGIDFRAKHFGSQRFAVPAQSFSRASLGRFQDFNRAFESFFRDPQGLPHHCDFLVRLGFPLRPKQPARRADSNFVRSEFPHVTKRKICGHNRRFHAAFFEKMREDFFIWRRFFRFSLHFALELAEHDELIRIGLFAPAIDFQIA